MNTKIFIQNLKCNGCAATITKKLSHLENITDIKVAIEESSATFNYKYNLDLEVVKGNFKRQWLSS